MYVNATCIYIVICVTVVNGALKHILKKNFQKSRINTYTWNLGMYDTSSERKEFTLYDGLC